MNEGICLQVRQSLIKLELMASSDLIAWNKKSICIEILKIIQNCENLDHICPFIAYTLGMVFLSTWVYQDMITIGPRAPTWLPSSE